MAFHNFLAALQSSAVLADNLEDPDERAKAKHIEQLFTTCVDVLRKTEDSDIRSMGADAWKTVEYRHVHVAIHPEVLTLSMAVIAIKGLLQNVIFIPPMWDDMVSKDPLRQLGAVAFVCSQAVDAYNGVTIDPKRAMAYEGILLRQSVPTDPDEWQLKAMGMAPPRELSYQRKPVLPLS